MKVEINLDHQALEEATSGEEETENSILYELNCEAYGYDADGNNCAFY